MAHFAKINENNIVEQVIVVDNAYAPDEATGQAFIASIGLEGTWLQTSYNTVNGVHYIKNMDGMIPSGKKQFRGNCAGQGFQYDEKLDAFIEPQPNPTYVLNTTTFRWEAPETSSK